MAEFQVTRLSKRMERQLRWEGKQEASLTSDALRSQAAALNGSRIPGASHLHLASYNVACRHQQQ